MMLMLRLTFAGLLFRDLSQSDGLRRKTGTGSLYFFQRQGVGFGFSAR